MNNTPPDASRQSSFPAFVWWVTTIAWGVTIYQLSTETFSGVFSRWLLSEILTLLSVEVSPATFHLLHILLRKLAHLTEYGIYALLLYGSLGGGRDFSWRGRRAGWCIGIAAVYSLTDELHQLFVPGRGGSLADSALDTSGSALALLAVYIVDRLRQARARRTAAKKESPAEA